MLPRTCLFVKMELLFSIKPINQQKVTIWNLRNFYIVSFHDCTEISQFLLKAQLTQSYNGIGSDMFFKVHFYFRFQKSFFQSPLCELKHQQKKKPH